MLKIQILGKGLVPRGLGLAPILEPIPVDENIVGTIFATTTLELKYLNPINGRLFDLTRENYLEVFRKYNTDMHPEGKVIAPDVEEKPAPAPKEPVKEEPVPVVVVEEKSVAEEVKEEAPINKDEKSDNHIGKNKHRK